jgi:tetratricopeptide (TPR) repeat protein
LVLGAEPDFQEALNHHLKAIDLAAKHASDAHLEVRRMAKDILVDAHLAIAQDIALGNFQRQREVVPKWLSRATELAEEFIRGDEGDETVRMEIYRTTLAIYSVLDGNFDASIATDEAIKEGQRLVGDSKDRSYQFRVERELSEALYHAAKVEHRCGRMTTALKYANNAVVLMEADQKNLQPSLFDRVMTGQLYFLMGSIYAMQDEDHAEAVKWFDKALPTFDDSRLANLVDSSAFGDIFVSMGVSYWETGDRSKAIELTQAGADLMQQGVQTGSIELAALAVPYGNLAAMHQEMGNGEKAKHYATMLAKVESETQQVRR